MEGLFIRKNSFTHTPLRDSINNELILYWLHNNQRLVEMFPKEDLAF